MSTKNDELSLTIRCRSVIENKKNPWKSRRLHIFREYYAILYILKPSDKNLNNTYEVMYMDGTTWSNQLISNTKAIKKYNLKPEVTDK